MVLLLQTFPDVEQPVLTPKEERFIKEVAFECRRDLKTFCRVLFPLVFYLPFSKYIHDPIFDLLDNSDNPYKAIKGPRDCGKTVIIGFAHLLRRTIYRRMNYGVLLSASMELAIKDSVRDKNELAQNTLIQKIFGNFRPEDREDDYSKSLWVTRELPPGEHFPGHPGTLIRASSWKMAIRGIQYHTKYGIFRPDGIYVDDTETPEMAQSEPMREHLREKVLVDIMNLVQDSKTIGQYEFPFEIIFSGTVLHSDSLIERVVNDKMFDSVSVSLVNPQTFESYWPEYKTTEEIAEKKAFYDRQGLSHQFYQEFLGKNIDPAKAEFREEYFQTFEENDLKNINCANFVLVDLARTKTAKSSDTVIMGISFSRDTDCFYVRDLVYGTIDPIMFDGREGGKPTESLIEIFSMGERLSTVWSRSKVAYDRTGLGLYIDWPLENYNVSNGHFFELIPINLSGDKDDRIRALAPLHRMGRIKYNPRLIEPIKLQLLEGPRAAKKDLADTLSLIIPLMGIKEQYFSFGPRQTRVSFGERLAHIHSTLYAKMGPSHRQKINI